MLAKAEGDSAAEAVERAPATVSERDRRWLHVWTNVLYRTVTPGAIAAVTMNDPNIVAIKALDFRHRKRQDGISSEDLLRGFLADMNTEALRRAMFKEPTQMYEMIKRLQRKTISDRGV